MVLALVVPLVDHVVGDFQVALVLFLLAHHGLHRCDFSHSAALAGSLALALLKAAARD